MADGEGRKPNSLLNAQDQLEQLGKEFAESLKNRSLEEQRSRQRAEMLQNLQQLRSSGALSDTQIKKYFPHIKDPSRIPNMIQTQRSKIHGHVQSSVERISGQFARAVENRFASTEQNSLIRRAEFSPALSEMVGAMNQMSYKDVEEMAISGRAEIESIGRQAGRTAKSVFSSRTVSDPNQFGSSKGFTQLGKHLQSRDELINVVAAAESSMRQKRLLGQDPKSLEARQFGYIEQARMMELGQNIAATGQYNTVATTSQGSVKAGDQITANIQDASNNLSQLFRELADNTKKLSMASEKDREALEQHRNAITDAIKTTEDAVKASSGGGGSNRGNWAAGLGALAGGFGAMGGAAQNILITQRMQQTANTAGFANLANQQYDMYQKARSGDIASQLALSQWGAAGQFGTEMRRGANTALGLQLAGAAAQTGAGAVQLAEGGVQKFNPMAHLLGTGAQNTQEAIGGALNITQGLATGASVGTDLMRGASSRAAELAGIQANMQARLAINAIPARQMQGLRDFYTGLDVVGQGMGRNASQFIGAATSTGNLTRMANARISPEQFSQMSQIGIEQMGSTFNMDQIFGARNLERQGFGSMQTNMTRMSQLAQAGANNPQANMDSILSNAVRAGLDSSKSIDSMVQHTAAMVAVSGASTAAGINTFNAQSSLLANSIDPNIKNKEFALQRAATAQEVARNITTDTSVSFTGMVNTSRISKTTGLGGTDALFAARLTTADIKSLQGMNPKDAQEALLKKGVDISSVKGGVGGFLQNMLENQTQQMFTGSGALAFGDNKTRESLVRASLAGKSYGQLSREEKNILGKVGTTSNLTGEEYYNTSMGINKPVNQGGESLSTKKTTDDLKNQMDQLRTSGFKQLSESAISVTKDLEKFGGALKVFAELQKQFEKDGVGTEKQFAGAGGEFAKDFKVSIGKFDKATDAYSQASAAMMRAAGLLSNGLPWIPNSIMNGTVKDQRAGSTRGGND